MYLNFKATSLFLFDFIDLTTAWHTTNFDYTAVYRNLHILAQDGPSWRNIL